MHRNANKNKSINIALENNKCTKRRKSGSRFNLDSSYGDNAVGRATYAQLEANSFLFFYSGPFSEVRQNSCDRFAAPENVFLMCLYPEYVDTIILFHTALKCEQVHMGRVMRKHVFGHMRTAKAQIRLRISIVQGLRCPLTESLDYRMYHWREIARMRLCACAG